MDDTQSTHAQCNSDFVESVIIILRQHSVRYTMWRPSETAGVALCPNLFRITYDAGRRRGGPARETRAPGSPVQCPARLSDSVPTNRSHADMTVRRTALCTRAHATTGHADSIFVCGEGGGVSRTFNNSKRMVFNTVEYTKDRKNNLILI